MSYFLSFLAVVLAYVIGSIPFAYVIVRWKKGIDIRTFGSGNVGATNAGRILGFGYFLIVFVLDLAKGYLPTWGFPELLKAQANVAMPGLAVLIAVASILGHNYTCFLGFRGGKGVATSLGAVAALDPVAGGAAALTFIVVLLMTRYVSMGSILGGIVFALIHFGQVEHPWNKDHLLMSCTVLGLLAMLIVRHRKNIVRIGAGTEPKVSFRKKRAEPPRGRIRLVAMLIIAGIGGAVGVSWYATRTQRVDLGTFSLTAVSRVATGHQRAERVLFLDRGDRLAVTCPRYNRVQIYRIDPLGKMTLELDREVDGKPVALAAHGDRLFVLQRPSGDARHVEEGYFETFNRAGKPLGSKVRVGFDPDDLVVTRDGTRAFVINSGHAEGESNRPAPAVLSIQLDGAVPKIVNRQEFLGEGDDPERLSLSADELHLRVALRGSDLVADVAIGGETSLLLAGFRDRRGAGDREFVSASNDSRIYATDPDCSGIEAFDSKSQRSLGSLQLRGAANLSPIRPMGIDYSAERGLIAVGSRNGAVHLVKVEEAGRPVGPLALGSTSVKRRDQ